MALLPGYRWLEKGKIIPKGARMDTGPHYAETSLAGERCTTDLFYMVPIVPEPKPRCVRSYRPQETSLQAHDSQREKAPTDMAKILEQIGSGSTCDELEFSLVLSHQTASARVRDLAKAGRIRDSGRRRKTRTGRSAIVWEVVEKGLGT